MIKQESGFALMTEDSWKSHLHMVKMQFLQEVTREEAEELVSNYEQDFVVSEVSEEQVYNFQSQFSLDVNETRKITSLFGSLNHF